jgi:hypothetical protein
VASFYFDHNVAVQVSQALHSLGHNVTTARDLRLEYAEDDEHLLVASEQNWILVTHDGSDFTLLHDAWQRWSRAWRVQAHHGGVLVIPHRWKPDQVARELSGFAQAHLALQNQLYAWNSTKGWERRPDLK